MENVDTRELVECPYDKHHQIRKSRMQVHLVRCRRNHPKAKKVTCPFNVTHVLNEQELKFHVEICTERQSFENYRNAPEPVTSPTIPPPMPAYQCEEDWDDADDVPSYNPQSYASNAAVLRNIQGVSPAQRKAFRKKERLRLMGIADLD